VCVCVCGGTVCVCVCVEELCVEELCEEWRGTLHLRECSPHIKLFLVIYSLVMSYERSDVDCWFPLQ
jgi:hypothetical protein